MNIVIDFGNTRAKIGIIENEDITNVYYFDTENIRTKDFISLLGKPGNEYVYTSITTCEYRTN
jgi:pantothenate kinase type III